MILAAQPYKHAISTHSLTRRLTPCATVLSFSSIISTHSLTRRLTTFGEKIKQARTAFQLTASQGG